MRAAVEHLRAGGAPRVAVIGLSLGGHVAYLAATAIDIDAVVCAYPGWLAGTEIGLSRPEPTLTLTPGISGRVLILTGSDDHAVPDADREAIAQALRDAGVDHEVVVYPQIPHGFLCDRRDTYDADARPTTLGSARAVCSPRRLEQPTRSGTRGSGSRSAAGVPRRRWLPCTGNPPRP